MGKNYHVNNYDTSRAYRPHVDLKTPANKVNFRQNPRVLGRLPRLNLIYWELGVVNLTRKVGFRLRPVQVKAKLIIRREAAKFLTLWHAFPFENSI